MKTCKNCGALMTDEVTKCPKCGGSPDGVSDKAYDFGRQAGEQFASFTGGSFFGKDRTREFDPYEIKKNKILCAISYTGLFILPLIGSSSSPYCRFHANQSLMVLILWAIFSVIIGLLNALTGIPLLGFVFGIASWAVGTLCSLIQLSLFLYGCINTLMGKSKELPLIGKITIIK